MRLINVGNKGQVHLIPVTCDCEECLAQNFELCRKSSFSSYMAELSYDVPNLIDDDHFQDANNERRWRLSYLKGQFDSLELDDLFNRYRERISHGYFSQYLTLQIILVTTHLILLLADFQTDPNGIVPDLALYASISILSVLILIVTDAYVKKRPRLLRPLALCAFFLVFFVNIFIPLYYEQDNLRPAYTTYLIISNYIFLNIHNNLSAVIFGIFMSIVHLTVLILVTYDNQDLILARIASDTIYLACINALGIYFRYMNEIVIRRSFLDKRSCVVSTHQLKFEEEQENQLMSSIIPQHVIDKVKQQMLSNLQERTRTHTTILSKNDPMIENHDNVTILFADIVNYSKMTTIYTNAQPTRVVELLEILNELFSRFDDASRELGVLRIKFLGDCYYCVAGLPPEPAPNHAEACVDLGLQMIEIISDIGRKHNLDINMRIGIHTGKISSGVIGILKWQYDIWSTDVDTANKMETEGESGKIHITLQTKKLLTKRYNIVPTHKLVNNNPTYLISPSSMKSENHQTIPRVDSTNSITSETIDNEVPVQPRPSIFIKNDIRNSVKNHQQPLHRSTISEGVHNHNGNSENHTEEYAKSKRHTLAVPTSERRFSVSPTRTSINKRISSTSSRASMDRKITPNDLTRRTAFMNNNIKRYKERLEAINKELQDTIEKMRLSKFEQYFKDNDVYRFILTFKSLKTELKFISLADPLFKYYLITSLVLIFLVYVIDNLTLSRWDWPGWPFYTMVGLSVFLFLPLSWTHFIWSKYVARNEIPPKNKIVRFFYDASKYVTNNIIIRTVIYTLVYVLFFLSVLLEWIECPDITLFSSEPRKSSFLNLVFVKAFEEKEQVPDNCIVPWHMTETCALAIIVSFLFIRMYVWLKLFYACIITIIYTLCIFQFNISFYGDSQTFNLNFQPKMSHAMSVIFLTLTLHMVDRQTEYMNRLDFLWYAMLIEKQKQANTVHQINNVLLKNILPIHVAELYLNVNRPESLYHENYDDVAVMFATITDFNVEDMGDRFLRIMNKIISSFDMLSIGDQFGRPIEKIKIAKWTYMAACGVAPGVGSIENIRKDPGNHAVIALLKFAAGLMRELQNERAGLFQQMKLRIGLCYGPIAAGVVGSKKPFYDIWGDAVNMASRMDSTGIPGKIQVFGETAEIIKEFGYALRYRGKVNVKGRDQPVPTYFVELDHNYDLVKAGSVIAEVEEETMTE